jgi:nitrous oxidase accessory protein NosD
MNMPQALAAAADNPGADTIDVRVAKVAPFVVNDGAVTIRGNGAEIDASSKPYGIVVDAPWVKITGFEIYGSKDAGIVVKGHHVTIEGNEVRDGAGSGIVGMKTDFTTIKDNFVHDLDGPRVVAGITIWQPTEIKGYADLWARIKVIGNVVEDIHQDGLEGFTVLLDGKPSAGYEHRILVQDNHGSDSDQGMMAFLMDDFVFRDNHSEGAERGGQYRFRGSSGLVEDNLAVGQIGYVAVGQNDIDYARNEHHQAPSEAMAPAEHTGPDWLWFH